VLARTALVVVAAQSGTSFAQYIHPHSRFEVGFGDEVDPGAEEGLEVASGAER
jgi:hypothetical protein